VPSDPHGDGHLGEHQPERMNAMESSIERRVEMAPGPGSFARWFEAVSVLAVLAVGVVFTITGWDDFVGSGRFWVLVLLLVGGVSALAVIPLSGAGHHAGAGAVAIVAVVTPTGFAYPVNILMVIVAAIEFIGFWRARRS
jgi:hypothetical protein